MRVISGIARGTKLYSLEGDNTRPTLDRIKESLFNMIQGKLYEARVLDLFAGSGALGIEALSRGAMKATFCDQSKEAVQIIKRNIEKTHLDEKAEVVPKDYITCIKRLRQTYDIIFIDPPYKADIATKAVEMVLEYHILSEDGIIIVETDEEERELKRLKELSVKIIDLRKYGRVKLIFLNRKE